MQQSKVSMGLIQRIKNGGDTCECSLGNQLNAAAVYGSSSSYLRVPSMENFQIQSLMNLCDDPNFMFAWGSRGICKSSLY